jgi:DNA mismatch repair protein MutH
MLTRRTADWFDNAASLAEKREALNAAAFRGGFHVGRMLASDDESEQAAGVVGGILLLVLGLASESQMEQDVQSLGASLDKLQADWQSYLNKLQRGALP